MLIPDEWLLEARKRITPYIQQTPISYDSQLEAYLKWENQQITGSFKARGALNKILAMPQWERERGIVTASAGNHAAAVAFACSLVNAKVEIFIPSSTPKVKVERIQKFGSQIHFVEGTYGATEQAAIEYAKNKEAVYISPYNDGQVIAGQATLAIEFLEQLHGEEIKAVIVPVGGGGLISGVGEVLKSRQFYPDDALPLLIGVQSEASPYMHNLYHFGNQDNITEWNSIADGLSGAVEPHSITIPIVKKHVDEFILVSEEDIQEAIRYAWITHNQVLEGSAATSIAAVLTGKIKIHPALLILTGQNIQPDVHREIIEGD
ncbi:MAG: threonine ammonia-lyase [Anaerolineales bacterium]